MITQNNPFTRFCNNSNALIFAFIYNYAQNYQKFRKTAKMNRKILNFVI